MHQVNVMNVDLNLLKALDALLETESVSKAADLVNLSQPAMSRALNRLQHAMKDPLLVRSGRGMVLTPRGEALRVPVREALAQVSFVFTPQIFDPSKAQNHFRIMAPDYLAQMIVSPILGKLFGLAPGLQIDIEGLSATGIAELCEGKIALGFGVVNDGPTLENVASQALFEDRQICLMRKGHPLLNGSMTLKRYAAAPHALLSITGKGGGRIDEILKDHGLSRRIALRITHFTTINAVIAGTDLIITVPELLARHVMTDELQTMPLPRELTTPAFVVSQIWHERFTKDAAHVWLRRMIKTACSRDVLVDRSLQLDIATGNP